jgi:hypothetical protein
MKRQNEQKLKIKNEMNFPSKYYRKIPKYDI